MKTSHEMNKIRFSFAFKRHHQSEFQMKGFSDVDWTSLHNKIVRNRLKGKRIQNHIKDNLANSHIEMSSDKGLYDHFNIIFDSLCHLRIFGAVCVTASNNSYAERVSHAALSILSNGNEEENSRNI